MSNKEAAQVRVRLWSSGSYAVSMVDREAHTYTLVEGDGRHAAHVVEVTQKGWRERATASVFYPTGRGTLTVNVSSPEPAEVRRVTQTIFPNGTRRQDNTILEGKSLLRASRWDFPDGSSAIAEDLGHSHTVVYQRVDGLVTQTRQSKISFLLGGRRVTRTQLLDGSGQKIGSVVTMHTGNKVYVTTLDSQDIDIGNGQVFTSQSDGSTTTFTKNAAAGTSTWTTTTSSSEGATVTTIVDDGGGNTSTNTKFSLDTGEGTSITGTTSDTQGNLGKSTHSDSTTYHNADGSSFTLGSTTVDGDLTSKTSSVDDGQGNSSTTTVTYNSDGTYTITTESTDSNGNTSGDSQTYDQNGNPYDSGTGTGNIPGSGTTDNSGSGDGSGTADNSGSGGGDTSGSGSGSGGGDTSGSGGGSGGGDTSGSGGGDTSGSGTTDNSGSGGDTSGSGGGDSSMPSDDGTGETPRRHLGHSDGSFDGLLGGQNQGDGGQQFSNSMASQLQASVENGGTGWGDSSSDEGPGRLVSDQSIDIRQIASAGDDWGNMNNPRALVAFAGLFVGNERAGAANQLTS